MNDCNAFRKYLIPYQLNLALSSNQELTLIRQTHTLSRHKTLHKHNNGIFQALINAWLHFMKIIKKCL